eukprot:TRINITY_DN65472_c0_g1_i1.p1 TRINITY_DN65472_c0_g1~~TRINITY_DN65472_c0_g1_i1.p1  ORF type:complete len:438 (-),score=43.37 TRINITY_DN65472_c0_g1_i1:203-1516(-)
MTLILFVLVFSLALGTRNPDKSLDDVLDCEHVNDSSGTCAARYQSRSGSDKYLRDFHTNDAAQWYSPTFDKLQWITLDEVVDLIIRTQDVPDCFGIVHGGFNPAHKIHMDLLTQGYYRLRETKAHCRNPWLIVGATPQWYVDSKRKTSDSADNVFQFDERLLILRAMINQRKNKESIHDLVILVDAADALAGVRSDVSHFRHEGSGGMIPDGTVFSALLRIALGYGEKPDRIMALQDDSAGQKRSSFPDPVKYAKHGKIKYAINNDPYTAYPLEAFKEETWASVIASKRKRILNALGKHIGNTNASAMLDRLGEFLGGWKDVLRTDVSNKRMFYIMGSEYANYRNYSHRSVFVDMQTKRKHKLGSTDVRRSLSERNACHKLKDLYDYDEAYHEKGAFDDVAIAYFKAMATCCPRDATTKWYIEAVKSCRVTPRRRLK